MRWNRYVGPRAYKDDLEESHTIGDMNAEEFFTGIGEAMGSAMEESLGRAGAGRVDRSALVTGVPSEDGDDPAAQARTEDTRQFLQKRGELRQQRQYGEGARVWYQFERDPEILALPNQEARDERVMEYLDFHDWAVAVNDKNVERANAIALVRYPRSIQRQLSTGAGSGGALVPTILEGPIMEKRAEADKLTSLSSQHTVSSGTLDLAVEGTNITGFLVAENADATESNPTYDPVLLRLKKSIAFTASSRELIDDAAASMSLVRNISSQAGRALGLINNNQNLLGDGVGTNYTDGILNNSAIEEVATGVVLTRAALLQLFFAMLAEFRDRLIWIMNSTNLERASNLETTAGNPLYPNAHLVQSVPVTGDGPGGFGQIEGIPVVAMEDVGDVVILANMEFFNVLLNAGGIRVETTTEGDGAFLADQQKWKFVQRQDAAVGLPLGFKKSVAFTS